MQGLTLPGLIRWLGVRAGPDEHRADVVAQASAQEAASEAGLRRLEELAADDPAGAPPEVVERLRRLAGYRQAGAWERLPGQPGAGVRADGPAPSAAFRRLRREMTTAERAEFIRLRDERQIDDEVLDEVLHHLDLEEAMLSRDEWDTWDAASGDPGPGTPVSG